MNSISTVPIWLKFPLSSEEDDWPPVSVESLPFQETGGYYQAIDPPLFIKDLSAGDVIAATIGDDKLVKSWHHVQRSHRTTIWLLAIKPGPQIDQCLQILRGLECNTVGSEALGCYAIDIPENVPIDQIDAALNGLDRNVVAVAFPSMRHPE